MAAIDLQGIVKDYARVRVVHGVDLHVDDGEFIAFVGPSGCGKSTLLRMIAGLEEISAGTLRIGDRIVNDTEPRDRDVAMVFQDYALYPHMTVRRNIGFGVRMRGGSRNEETRRVDEVAQILQITDLLDRKPGELSGGQRQRVAMGRAIVRKPAVYLFDEPLSNLDAKLRVDMRLQIKRLHTMLGTTTVYVTHDQVEAMTLADRIVILRDGRIEQQGTPASVYASPANRFVAEFIGSPQMNMLEGVLANDTTDADKLQVQVGSIRIPVGQLRDASAGDPVQLGFRPEHLMLDESAPVFNAEVLLLEPTGSDTMALCNVEGQEITARLPADLPVAPGQQLRFSVTPDRRHVFSARTSLRLNVSL